MMGWFEEAMVESEEEREFFAKALAGQKEWRAEEFRRIANYREGLASNLAAQAFAPEGNYAYLFDKDGFPKLTPHAVRMIDYDDDDEEYINRIRIKAATRRL